MGMSFQKYIQRKKVNNQIETVAQLVTETGFPIERFYEWYCDEGVYLSSKNHGLIVEGFWGDTAKGAGVGALAGGVGGGIPGALVGGGLGAIGGAARHIGRGVQKWWNPNAYKINTFARKKDEIVQMLSQMQVLANEIRNDTNFAKGSANSIHSPEFDELINKLERFLRTMETPKLVGAGSGTPSGTPGTPPGGTSPTPSGTPGPKDEGEVAASPEFKNVMNEVEAFTKSLHYKMSPDQAASVASSVWEMLQSGHHKWPDVLDTVKEEIIFEDADKGYQELIAKIKADTTMGPWARYGKEFYLIARIDSLNDGLDPSALAAKAKKMLDQEKADHEKAIP